MGAPEAIVEDYLTRGAARRGFAVYKLGFRNRWGAPDRILFGHGMTVMAEAKRERGGRLSPRQKRCHEALRTHGADVRVVAGRDEADALLDEMATHAGITVSLDDLAVLADGHVPDTVRRTAAERLKAVKMESHTASPRSAV